MSDQPLTPKCELCGGTLINTMDVWVCDTCSSEYDDKFNRILDKWDAPLPAARGDGALPPIGDYERMTTDELEAVYIHILELFDGNEWDDTFADHEKIVSAWLSVRRRERFIVEHQKGLDRAREKLAKLLPPDAAPAPGPLRQEHPGGMWRYGMADTTSAIERLFDTRLYYERIGLKEYRKDGWPLCPQCGEDELFSYLDAALEIEAGGKLPLRRYVEAGLRCHKCDWHTDGKDGRT